MKDGFVATILQTIDYYFKKTNEKLENDAILFQN